MKRICVFLLFLLPPSLASAQTDTVQQHADSLRAVVAAANGEAKLNAYEELKEYLYYNETDPESVLEVLTDYEREAMRQGNQRKTAASRANTMQIMYERNLFKELLESADADLKFLADREEWNLYFKSYSNVVMALFRDGQHDKATEEAAKCREEAERVGTPFARANSLYLTGLLHGWNARAEEELKYFAEAMRAAGHDPDCDQLKLQIYGYSMQAMFNTEDMDGLKKLLADWETEIARQQAAGANVRATQINLYGGYARYYMGTKEWNKMEEYCVLLEQSYNHPDGLNILHQFRTMAAMARGDWGRALEHLDVLYKYAEETDSQMDKFATTRERTRVMIMSGRRDDALVALNSMLKLHDSISDMEFNRQLTELQTQYEVEQHIAEKERNRNYFFFALGGCLLLAVALGIYIYYSRKMARKNRELVRKAQQWANVEPVKTAEPDEADRLLFFEIELLIDNGLYKESSLSLDMLAEKTNQNPTYISKAVSRCTGKTFKVWLNEYRIKEAVRLLSDKNNPIVSIDTLAFESGFNNRTTFYRVFKKMTGLSPTDFKKNGLSK